MKRLTLLIICLNCISHLNAYFYPICSKTNDKSCIAFPKFPKIFKQVPVRDGSGGAENTLGEILDTVLNDGLELLKDCYQQLIIPTIDELWKTTHWYVIALLRAYYHCVQYIPWLKEEEKVKADCTFYILFIISSVTVYLILYVYFTKKLYYHYLSKLRAEYLTKVQTVLKAKH